MYQQLSELNVYEWSQMSVNSTMTIKQLKNELKKKFKKMFKQGFKHLQYFDYESIEFHIVLKNNGKQLVYLNKTLQHYGISPKNNEIVLDFYRLGHKLNRCKFY